MSSALINGLYVFMLAAFIGFRSHPASFASAAHSAHVAHQCPRRHRGRRRHRAGGRAQEHAFLRVRRPRRNRRHQQRRGRISDHRSHAQNVQVQPPDKTMTTDFAGNQQIIEITYLIASVLFHSLAEMDEHVRPPPGAASGPAKSAWSWPSPAPCCITVSSTTSGSPSPSCSAPASAFRWAWCT